jgi:hypothetical protein
MAEFGGGIAGRMEIGWVSGQGRERMFKVVVGEEVIMADWRIIVRVRCGGVIIEVWIQST